MRKNFYLCALYNERMSMNKKNNGSTGHLMPAVQTTPQITLPADFAAYTQQLMGDARYKRFTTALAEEPPVSIRINGSKCTAVPPGATAVPWCDGGYYLTDRPGFTFDPLLHAGHYYVQEASSMFVTRVLSQYVNRRVMMLDMCAAPGGKSTAALGVLPPGSTLMTNEPMRQRAQILAENIQKWGCPNVIVTNNYPADYVRSGITFDVILCDVPCSGEGMFRKDAGAIGEWSTQNVADCSSLQRNIVADAWQCLRPGGLLIYSTCTFNAHENEENIAWICRELGAGLLPVDIASNWGIQGPLTDDVAADAPVYRFIPGYTQGEGLFCAALRKPTDDDVSDTDDNSIYFSYDNTASTDIADSSKDNAKKRKKDRKNSKDKHNERQASGKAGTDTDAIKAFTKALPDDYVICRNADTIMAMPPLLAQLYDVATRSLRILSAGVTVGTAKGHDIIPHQALAMSTVLRREAFPTAELTYAEAIAYLRKEAVSMPEGTPRGFVLVCFRGTPLGFVKNIGTRANNLYPPEWRIKSTHVPDEPHIIE